MREDACFTFGPEVLRPDRTIMHDGPIEHLEDIVSEVLGKLRSFAPLPAMATS